MNKKTIITILLALVAMAEASDAFDFRINYKDVAIAVNKDIAGNQVPDEETAVGEATLAVRFLETEGGHALLPLKGGHMRLASSRLRFM